MDKNYEMTTGENKSWLVTLLLCFFGGTLGLHRFYVGKIGTGILMLITFGAFGLWAIIDLIIIIMGNFQDKNGKRIYNDKNY